ncbi:hypothetical protein [Streptacidiphilus sp. P02-A3a]|uniref:hypothetical protein n=1 Tax=Streptacidiphilus sp. P02-A3a TaxID=2704468 RepID=UPI0015FC810C|nr:hypothetical protein [Streptacidiphilus sp. P02-A3a]QMU71715.1 hypothetical protein GXP74_29185 [Streptacidiphilus sp. P02-A3a]
MRRIFRTAAALAMALCVLLGLGATQAVASPVWTVSGGGALSATATPLPVQLLNASGFVVFSCTSSAVTGNAPNGTALPGTSLITFSGFPFSGCTAAPGVASTLTIGTLPLTLTATAYSSATGITTGVVPGFVLILQNTVCTARFSGALNATYDNSTHNLTLQNKLPASGVTGCLGLINNGDILNYTITYHLTTLHITSP